jgi:serine protease
VTLTFLRLTPIYALLAAIGLHSLPAQAGGKVGTAPPQAIGDSTDRLIVRLRDHEASATLSSPAARVGQLGSRLGLSLQPLRGMSGNAQVLQLNRMHTRAEAAALAHQLAQDPDVLYAEPDLRMVALRAPNDSAYPQQWHYFEPAGGINLPAAWDRTVGSSSITVAVIDTGLVPHPDLAGRSVAGWDFILDPTFAQDGGGRDADPSDPGDFGCNGSSSSWHGTHVAGTIGAASDNGLGVAGVNWVSKIQTVRVLGRCGGYTSDIADAMRWSAGMAVAGAPPNATPARVLNLSLGGGGSCSTTYQNAINDVIARGAVVVVAAGNSNVDAANAQPASCNGVVAVGATTRSGGRAGFSNYGAKVALSAPGVSVLSTLNSGGTVPGSPSYAAYSGTSMATPHVAGVVSLMLSVNPALTPSQVLTALKSSARPFPTGTGADCTPALCGAGIVDAAAALAVVAGAQPPVPPPPASLNLALPAHGGVLTASSSFSAAYPPSGANNGDRKGALWGAGGGWNDLSLNGYADWLQLDLASVQSVAEVNVFTVQDNYANPAEPTEAMTFSLYGLKSFEVQYWTGAAWQTVPNGSVTGNNRVWRRFSFAPVMTNRLRVLVLDAGGGYSRITELEAYAAASATPTKVNHAAAAAGGTALASSSYSAAYTPASVNNGDRRGAAWGNGGGWNDASSGTWPDSVAVNFIGAKTITEISVFTLQDAFTAPQEPTEALTFTRYGITAFEVQTWDGSAWTTVPGGNVIGNDKVWRKFSFPAVTTSAVRVLVHAGLGGYSRVTEIEAYGPG